MTEAQADALLAVLERIAVALEKFGKYYRGDTDGILDD